MTLPSQTEVVILDTCVFSFVYGDKPEAAPFDGVIPAVTFVTVGELLKGRMVTTGQLQAFKISGST